MSINDYGTGTHTCGQDVVEGRRVVLNSSDLIVYADATTAGHGITKMGAESGEDVAVNYPNKPGTTYVTAADGFNVGQDVYAAANGKVQALPIAAGTYFKVGVAQEAAAEDGDLVEILPLEWGKEVTVA